MYARVGRLIAQAVGTIHKLRSNTEGALVVQALGPEYADAVLAGRVFSVANQAAVSTTAALATTWTGLAVVNPATSVKNLHLLEFGAAQLAAGAAGGIGLMIATPGDLASSLTPVNALVGNGAVSCAFGDAGGTPGTPVLYRVFGAIGSVATTAYGLIPGLVVPLRGSLIIPPGYAVLTYTTAATTTALAFHLMWEEVTA